MMISLFPIVHQVNIQDLYINILSSKLQQFQYLIPYQTIYKSIKNKLLMIIIYSRLCLIIFINRMYKMNVIKECNSMKT